MLVHSEQEAMFVACEMESTAVQLYTRALQLLDQLGRKNDPVYPAIEKMLMEEKGHLFRFRSLYHGLDEADEQQLSLAAIGEGLLFEGGLLGAARKGLLKDPESMLQLAISSERASARKYREFAAAAETQEARDALLMIAAEEDGHLLELEGVAQQRRHAGGENA